MVFQKWLLDCQTMLLIIDYCNVAKNRYYFFLFIVSCSVKDCTYCSYKDNCTRCDDTLVPTNDGTACSPFIVVDPPTKEPGRGSGLNTGAIIG